MPIPGPTPYAGAMPRSPHLILGAYACHPVQGSEPTVGWNRAVEASRFGHVDVITHDDGNGPALRRAVEERGLDGLRFHVLPHTPFERWLRATPGGYYRAYRTWNRRAYRLALDLHRQRPFDLAHQVNLCGYREPGDLWRLGIPFVWGPVGGTQNTPAAYLASGGARMLLAEGGRTVLNRLQLRLSPRVRRAARAADVLLAANSTVQREVERAWGRPAHRLLETGVRSVGDARRWADREPGPFRLLWAGEVVPRKGIHLILDAHRQLAERAERGGPEVELVVAGDGPEMDRVRRAPGVRALGRIARPELLELYRRVDAFAFTSLRDTSGNVMLEALAAGLPVVYLDHQGARDMGSLDSGIAVPVSTPQASVRGLVDAVADLATDPRRYDHLSRGAIQRAERFCWHANGDVANRLYADLLGRPPLSTGASDRPTFAPPHA